VLGDFVGYVAIFLHVADENLLGAGIHHLLQGPNCGENES
jgi:hypothetical protein